MCAMCLTLTGHMQRYTSALAASACTCNVDVGPCRVRHVPAQSTRQRRVGLVTPLDGTGWSWPSCRSTPCLQRTHTRSTHSRVATWLTYSTHYALWSVSPISTGCAGAVLAHSSAGARYLSLPKQAGGQLCAQAVLPCMLLWQLTCTCAVIQVDV